MFGLEDTGDMYGFVPMDVLMVVAHILPGDIPDMAAIHRMVDVLMAVVLMVVVVPMDVKLTIEV